jgi:hypothetical protein
LLPTGTSPSKASPAHTAPLTEAWKLATGVELDFARRASRTELFRNVLRRDVFGRVNAALRGSGRGRHRAWVVSHAELSRLQRDGLLPPPSRRAS